MAAQFYTYHGHGIAARASEAEIQVRLHTTVQKNLEAVQSWSPSTAGGGEQGCIPTCKRRLWGAQRTLSAPGGRMKMSKPGVVLMIDFGGKIINQCVIFVLF